MREVPPRCADPSIARRASSDRDVYAEAMSSGGSRERVLLVIVCVALSTHAGCLLFVEDPCADAACAPDQNCFDGACVIDDADDGGLVGDGEPPDGGSLSDAGGIAGDGDGDAGPVDGGGPVDAGLFDAGTCGGFGFPDVELRLRADEIVTHDAQWPPGIHVAAVEFVTPGDMGMGFFGNTVQLEANGTTGVALAIFDLVDGAGCHGSAVVRFVVLPQNWHLIDATARHIVVVARSLDHGANLQNFPVPLRLSAVGSPAFDPSAHALVVTDQSGTPLSIAIEGAPGALLDEQVVWVRLPNLPSGSATGVTLHVYGGLVGETLSSTNVFAGAQARYGMSELDRTEGALAALLTEPSPGVTTTIGPIGRAALFDGASHIALAHMSQMTTVPFLRDAEGGTLSLWFRSDAPPAIDVKVIAALGTGGATPTDASRMNIDVQNDRVRATARVRDTGDSTWRLEVVGTNGPQVSDNVWHHVAAVVWFQQQEPRLTLYVDGVELGTDNKITDDLSSQSFPDTDSNYAAIGAEDHGLNAFFTGAVDDVRVVDEDRSAASVRAEHRVALPTFAEWGTLESY